MILSCSSSTEPEKSAKDYTEDGWVSFSEQDYTAAEESFTKAIKIDKKMADAYSGAGWSIAYQKRYSEAVSQWRMGINNDAVNADIYAGLTVVYQALDSLAECVESGNKLAALDADYAFQYDANINISLIHGLLAAAHYGLQDYVKAAKEMDLAVPANAPHNSDDLKLLLNSIMDFLGLQ
jgi:Tfp pilus assembly protein PilF